MKTKVVIITNGYRRAATRRVSKPCVKFTRAIVVLASTLPHSKVWSVICAFKIEDKILYKINLICRKDNLKGRIIIIRINCSFHSQMLQNTSQICKNTGIYLTIYRNFYIHLNTLNLWKIIIWWHLVIGSIWHCINKANPCQRKMQALKQSDISDFYFLRNLFRTCICNQHSLK